jgi:hypothetical protein
MESTPLTIAAITAVLRDLLANGLIRYSDVSGLGDVNVTVVSPDRIATGAEEPNQLNLFLYGVAPHAALAKRNVATRPPARLGLDLQYLLTVYGGQDFHRETLLGCAVHLLDGVPVLTRDVIRDTLGSAAGNGHAAGQSPLRAALSSAGVVDSFDRVRIRPQFMSFEDMSKLWSIMQARYRPSVAYQVSAVPVSARE